MKKPKEFKYQKRIWLCPQYYGMSALSYEMVNHGCSLRIQDCHDVINLDFGFWNNKDQAAAIRKADRLLAAVQEFRDRLSEIPPVENYDKNKKAWLEQEKE